MHGLAALQAELIGSLFDSLARELHKLLDITRGSLEIGRGHMETNGWHLGLQSSVAQKLALLRNIQRSPKHTKNEPTGSRLDLPKVTLQILEQ